MTANHVIIVEPSSHERLTLPREVKGITLSDGKRFHTITHPRAIFVGKRWVTVQARDKRNTLRLPKGSVNVASAALHWEL